MDKEIKAGSGAGSQNDAAGATTAPRIVVLISDLMFGSKVREVLNAAGMKGEFVASPGAVAAALCGPAVSAGAFTSPGLLIVDLGDPRIGPVEAIREAVSRGIPVLAYGSHVDEAAFAAARQAGATRVVPRSMFSARLPELIAELVEKERDA